MQFEGGIYGKAVLQNCFTKVLLKNTEDGARRIQSLLNLTDEEVERIQRYKNGKCLLLIGNLKLELQFEASELEDELISTDSESLKRISEKKQEEINRRESQNDMKEITKVKYVPLIDEDEYYRLIEDEESEHDSQY